MTHSIRTCLWFDGVAHEAAEFYVSLLPNSSIDGMHRASPDQPPFLVEFSLGGVPYQAMNGGPQFKLSEATSISVTVEDQAEVDRLWEALVADGGEASRAGWCKDRFGLSWQVLPEALSRLFADPDREAAGRAMQAMMGMEKIEVAKLESAFRGE